MSHEGNILKQKDWQDKISNPAQVGGIETSIIDNGPGRNTRIAWINTGTGLRYKVVIDRSLDIVDAFYNQYSLAWLSHGGITPPEASASSGIDWLKTFSGGLITTCGLTHIGGPEEDEFGTRGLHDQISNIPSEISSIVQPDPLRGKLEMSITGTMKQTQVFGNRLELRRTISSTLGQSFIRIEDEVINAGNQPSPHMYLYHINFGWPLVDAGTHLLWKGSCQSRGGEMDDQIFSAGNDFKTCKAPLDTHKGYGEACGFIDAQTDADGMVHCGVHNTVLGFAMAIRYKKEQLPWLSNWQHWGKREYVTALEPGTHPPIGQAAARKQQSLIFLEPGESKSYQLEIELLTEKEKIETLINKTN